MIEHIPSFQPDANFRLTVPLATITHHPFFLNEEHIQHSNPFLRPITVRDGNPWLKQQSDQLFMQGKEQTKIAFRLIRQEPKEIRLMYFETFLSHFIDRAEHDPDALEVIRLTIVPILKKLLILPDDDLESR